MTVSNDPPLSIIDGQYIPIERPSHVTVTYVRYLAKNAMRRTLLVLVNRNLSKTSTSGTLVYKNSKWCVLLLYKVTGITMLTIPWICRPCHRHPHGMLSAPLYLGTQRQPHQGEIPARTRWKMTRNCVRSQDRHHLQTYCPSPTPRSTWYCPCWSRLSRRLPNLPCRCRPC